MPIEQRPDPQPMLGLATTEMLFCEIIARLSVSGGPGSHQRVVALAEMLGGLSANQRQYRTVDT